ncbi:hypothetical protein H0H87_005755 [Tephrocybe sp. NHM501043]|nr:hypothetical protein H0H87_005755 [Tephrocybe sp. NHM501043]
MGLTVYGLLRALKANKHWLLGCRRLVVETDAKYLKGMLSNPGVGPNSTIMRWIEDILMFHFTLCHVPGKTFSVDGLSRRTKQEGDEEFPLVEEEMLDDSEVLKFEYPDELEGVDGWEDHVSLALREFADQIDVRGGYMIGVASSEEGFQEELALANSEGQMLKKGLEVQRMQCLSSVAVMTLSTLLLPPNEKGHMANEPYPEEHRSGKARALDAALKRLQV